MAGEEDLDDDDALVELGVEALGDQALGAAEDGSDAVFAGDDVAGMNFVASHRSRLRGLGRPRHGHSGTTRGHSGGKSSTPCRCLQQATGELKPHRTFLTGSTFTARTMGVMRSILWACIGVAWA